MFALCHWKQEIMLHDVTFWAKFWKPRVCSGGIATEAYRTSCKYILEKWKKYQPSLNTYGTRKLEVQVETSLEVGGKFSECPEIV